jgi:REP element-mobilizing transposase RayT
MEAIMGAVCEDFGCELVEFNGETEHLHPLVNVPQPSHRPGGCGRRSPT